MIIQDTINNQNMLPLNLMHKWKQLKAVLEGMESWEMHFTEEKPTKWQIALPNSCHHTLFYLGKFA